MSFSGELPQAVVGYQDYRDPNFFASLEPTLVSTAREMAKQQAVSYRKFYVGACAAVLLAGEQVVFLGGANNSPYRGSPKRCAEMDILQQTEGLMDEYGHDLEMLDLYVAGPSDPDEIKGVTGRTTPTLHSCSDCRNLLGDHPATADHTRITTFGVDTNGVPMERHTLGGMLDTYRGIESPQASRQILAAAALDLRV